MLHLLNRGLLVILIATSCSNSGQIETVSPTIENNTNMEKDKIYLTALVYLKKGEEQLFSKYRSRAAAILEKHNARLEKIIQPTMLAKGDMALPSEIHFAVFDNEATLTALNDDPEYQYIINNYRTPAVDSLIIIPSKLSGFQFTREVGDSSKTYGIALLNYNNDKDGRSKFENYHDRACAIMPEFGTHFERFLIPTGIKGSFQQPDEIHRFYFDSMEGLQQMGTDPRMLNLFPLRDESLSRLNFIIGKSI